MRISTSMRWLVVAVSAAMLLAVAAACSSETVEVPGETVVVEKEVIKTVEVPGETVIQEVVKEVQVPGETVVVKEEVVKEVMVPGETVVVEKVITETVEVPGETVTVEVVKEVMVPGETVVVEKEVVKTVEVPGQTVVVEKVVTQTVEVPGETVVVEKEVVKTVEVPGETVVVEKEVVKTVEVPGPERVMVKEVPAGYVTDPSTGKAVIAPQYGGTFTFMKPAFGGPGDAIDPAAGATIPTRGAGSIIGFVNEKMGIGDWATDRDIFDFNTIYVPEFVLKGLLAESWDISADGLTYTFHIRKGVHYALNPDSEASRLINGRELTADDVVYSFHRVLGIGSGFTEVGALDVAGSLGLVPIESITAPDKYTVVFKLTEPFLYTHQTLLVNFHTLILPPEVTKEHGDYQDWRNVVGTGPYELVGSVEGTSFTWTKNPNYWGYDEKYPQNRLPYIDELRMLFVPEEVTRLAALRAGKVDYLGWIAGSNISSIDVVSRLQKTNPELNLWPQSFRGDAFALNVQIPPFNDIKVRKAVSMALDLETINNTLYRGRGDTTPSGWIGRNVIGYRVEPEDWPEEVKEGYRYDPAGAEKLLDEAGYKRDADGVRFKTVMSALDYYGTIDYIALLMGNLRDIGIDVKMDVVDFPTWNAGRRSFQLAMFNDNMNFDLDPLILLRHSYSGSGPGSMSWNFGNVQDAEYNALVDAARAATTFDDLKRASQEAEMYKTSQYWVMRGVRAPFYSVTQPWVVGFNGEGLLGASLDTSPIFARLWIDSEMKKAMGR